jgi:hypothetical protein
MNGLVKKVNVGHVSDLVLSSAYCYGLL